MAIISAAEFEHAHAVLASRTAAELADFILSLSSSAAHGISEYAMENETATTDTGKAQGMWLVSTDGSMPLSGVCCHAIRRQHCSY